MSPTTIDNELMASLITETLYRWDERGKTHNNNTQNQTKTKQKQKKVKLEA